MCYVIARRMCCLRFAWALCLVFSSTNAHSMEIETLALDANSNESLEARFARENNTYELERIERVFSHIDQLFASAVIKVQPVDKNGELGPENITVLSEFLSIPHDVQAIEQLLERALSRKLKANEVEIVRTIRKPSLPKAIRKLWQSGHLSHAKARQIFLHNTPMSSQDLIRLVENGASRTETGYFVQLRTGHLYGDTLQLFDAISVALKMVKDGVDPDLVDIPTSHLLMPPLKPGMAAAFGPHSPFANEIIGDASIIRELRRHFLFVSSLSLPIRFRPGAITLNPTVIAGPAAVNPVSDYDVMVSPHSLSAMLIGNHYFSNNASSLSNSLFVNPLGVTYSGAYNWSHENGARGVEWWLNYSPGFLGGGINYTANFDKGTAWSNGQPSYVSFGVMGGGWSNNLLFGVSISTMLANGIGIGASGQLSITRSHDVTYLGLYPLDGMIASIRGLHKIQIDDTIGVGGQFTVAANFSAADVPVTVAFQVGAQYTRARVYRTHTDLIKAQDMLSEADVPGILYLVGKKIRHTRIPSFDKPENLIDGDELVETKIGRLSGTFVIGLETLVPISAVRVGSEIDVAAEFELGLQRLPNNKFQVSIKPERIYQIGLSGSILNILGAGTLKSMAIARKQIFIFDFMNPDARIAYFDLIAHGRLPTSDEIEVYTENRGPEYLLTEFRAQNDELASRGVARTYLEKIKVLTSKFHFGLSVPLMEAAILVINKIDEKARKTKPRLNLSFDGVDRVFERAHGKSVATNGIIAVRKSVFGGRRSKGQGFSGRYNQDLYVVHRRIYTVDDAPTEYADNKWQFDSLVVQFQLEDTKVTGNQENEMAAAINGLFSTFIGSFEYKNSKEFRIISLEREFSKKDFLELQGEPCRARVGVASRMTGISRQRISSLLESLKRKHFDHQGRLIKQFIETSPGASGFAALHQLLGAKPEELMVRTESGYTQAVRDAKRFITVYSKEDCDDTNSENNPRVALTALKTSANKKQAKAFFDDGRMQLRALDKQLRLLYDDKYLIDEMGPLNQVYGRAKVKELVERGMRQERAPTKTAIVSARKAILDMLDLKTHFPEDERMLIYDMAGTKRLRIAELVEIRLIEYEAKPISASMDKDYLRKRLKKTWALIAKIDERINKLEQDEVMQAMDPEYIDRYLFDLHHMRQRLAQTASTDHLDFFDLEELKEALNKSARIFRKRKSTVAIDGALATMYQGDNPDVSGKNDFTGRVPAMPDEVEPSSASQMQRRFGRSLSMVLMRNDEVQSTPRRK